MDYMDYIFVSGTKILVAHWEEPSVQTTHLLTSPKSAVVFCISVYNYSDQYICMGQVGAGEKE